MSYVVDEIVREYKARKAYEKIKRQQCKEKNCDDCQYQQICENCEVKDEV